MGALNHLAGRDTRGGGGGGGNYSVSPRDGGPPKPNNYKQYMDPNNVGRVMS